MCLTIRVATDEPLTPPYAPEVGGLGVRLLSLAEAGAFRAFSMPHVHEVTMQGACGCEFRHPEESPRRGLVWLLEWALRSVPEVELYVCWPGHEGAEPTARDWSTATELLHWRVFDGGELLVVRGDAEPEGISQVART
jgi:hypothetical protein